MQVKINDKMMELNNDEVRAARAQISRLLGVAREAGEKAKRTSYYFTFLIVMHAMSGELLDLMDADYLSLVTKAIEQARQTKQ